MAIALQDYVISESSSGTTLPGPPPEPSFLNIEGDFQQAYSTTEFAMQHAMAADGYISKLGELAAALVPPTVVPAYPQQGNAPAISTPAPPDIFPITYDPPPVPAPFSGTLSVDTTFPTFDALAPNLIFPNAPIAPNVSAPVSPAINFNFTYPTVDVSLPTAPDLLSIDVRSFDGVTFPVFDETSPVLTLVAPQVVNYVPNAPYTDALLSGLIGELESRLAIGITGQNTGLPPAVEENIWNRGREREAKSLADTIAALDKMEGMGYMLPHGAFIDARIKAETEFAAQSYGLSREVMIKQAELEQANIQKSMELAVSIESKLIDYANETEQRRFDACKYATDAGVAIYNAGVQAFAARVNGYRASVDVYTAQIAGARGIIEAYTAEIAAEKLKVDANTALIQEYKVTVDAALASIEVFKGEIQLVQTQAQIENLKVQTFGEQIKAYAAQINVFTSQVEAYRAQLSAEQTKEQIYGTQAQVFGSLVDAKVKTINAQIETFKALISEKVEEYDAYKAQVEGQAENVKALAAANSSISDIYRAEVQGTSSYNEALIKEFESINSIAAQLTQIGVSAAQANGQLYLTAKSVVTDAAKVGATVEAQLAASALGAVTWATHRSRQDSNGYSVNLGYANNRTVSTSTGSSDNTNHNFNVNQSTSQSFQSSVSNSTSTIHQINSVE